MADVGDLMMQAAVMQWYHWALIPVVIALIVFLVMYRRRQM